MFLFNQNLFLTKKQVTKIQIHLMFLFNFALNGILVIATSIQIHLMFLFNPHGKHNPSWIHKFKYISCSYLTLTTYNWRYDLETFKYISCSYLTLSLFPIFKERPHSNTSHVLI